MSEISHRVWGRHAVLEALRSGAARSILLATGRSPAPILREIGRLAAEQGVPVREVPAHEIERLEPGQNTQGVLAQVQRPRPAGIGTVLEIVAQAGRPAFLLALDQVQDPHNVGALLRTAEAAGVHGVIVTERRSAPISGTVAKVSAGAVHHLPIVEAANLVRTLEELRARGIWVVGLDGTATQSLYAADLSLPLTLVVGSEGNGLRRLTREHCDFLVHLPLLGTIESLNASVAGAIAMYEVVRQRLTGHVTTRRHPAGHR